MTFKKVHILLNVFLASLAMWSVFELHPANAQLAPLRRYHMVSLAFDDGYKDLMTNAIPFLNKYHYKSTQYIITKYLDGHDPNYMDAADVLALQKQGHEIGAHSRNHLDLTTLPADQASNEIFGSKQDLLNIGVNATSFAYPGGYYNPYIVDQVIQAGFNNGRGANTGWETSSPDVYKLKVFKVDSSLTLSDIEWWIRWARDNGVWLILLFHDVTPVRVDTNSVIQYNTTTKNFQDIVKYLAWKKIHVVTMAQGMSLHERLGQPLSALSSF